MPSNASSICQAFESLPPRSSPSTALLSATLSANAGDDAARGPAAAGTDTHDKQPDRRSTMDHPAYLHAAAEFIVRTKLSDLSAQALERGRWIVADCISVAA